MAMGRARCAFEHRAHCRVLVIAWPVAGYAVCREQRTNFRRCRVEPCRSEVALAQFRRRRKLRNRSWVGGFAGCRVVLDELVAVGRVDELHGIATCVFLYLLQSLRWWELFFLCLDESQGQRMLVFLHVHAEQVVHSATPVLDRFAVKNVDPYRALLAVNFAMRSTLLVLHEFNPLTAVQRRID